MKRAILLTLQMLLLCVATHAESLITLAGRVVDDKNRAMPQVNVRAVGSAIATVTNGDGEFTLKLPTSSSDDAIRFSSVGFTTQERSVSDLEKMVQGAKIRLHEESVQIGGIDVKLHSANKYIEEVLDRRHENYLNERNKQVAFYREMIKKRSSFATLTEAVVEVDKTGINGSDRAAIFKGRSLKDRRFTDTLFVKFQGGIVSALLLDLTKNERIVFGDEPTEDYNFWFDSPTTIDGRAMRVVTFNQRSTDPEVILYRGKLYIDSLTRSIARAEFNLNVEERPNSISAFVRRKPAGVKIEALGAHYTASYRLLDDKWQFDYCNSQLDFRCRFKRRIFRNNYTISSEMVVTDYIPTSSKIPFSKSVRSTDISYESAKDFYDENFWEHYNIIEHERSIDAVVKRFRRQLKEQ